MVMQMWSKRNSRFQLFTIEYDDSCGLIMYGLYYGKLRSLYTLFIESFIVNGC